MQKKLIMTLLTRNEDDILEDNICFHLAHGVDFIYVTDNGSTDRTPEILDKYVRKGVLAYRVVNDFTIEQAKWVSEMAEIAVKRYGATHLFHCDTDEFWYPRSGNLKTWLPQGNEIFYVSFANYLPGNKYVVSHPIDQLNARDTNGSHNYMLFRYPTKVITTSKFTRVVQGNHDVVTRRKTIKMNVNHVVIHHFMIRSYEHFKRKTITAGVAYEANRNKTKTMGWHSRSWYSLYKAGKLRKEYNALCLTERLPELLESGTIRKTRVPFKIQYAKEIFSTKWKIHSVFNDLKKPFYLINRMSYRI